MKKVRILETKFKQVNLLYQNQILQLKKTNKELEEKLSLYREHILAYKPSLLAELQKKLEERDHDMSFMSSSSSSSINNKSENQAMPVLSQII